MNGKNPFSQMYDGHGYSKKMKEMGNAERAWEATADTRENEALKNKREETHKVATDCNEAIEGKLAFWHLQRQLRRFFWRKCPRKSGGQCGPLTYLSKGDVVVLYAYSTGSGRYPGIVIEIETSKLAAHQFKDTLAAWSALSMGPIAYLVQMDSFQIIVTKMTRVGSQVEMETEYYELGNGKRKEEDPVKELYMVAMSELSRVLVLATFELGVTLYPYVRLNTQKLAKQGWVDAWGPTEGMREKECPHFPCKASQLENQPGSNAMKNTCHHYANYEELITHAKEEADIYKMGDINRECSLPDKSNALDPTLTPPAKVHNLRHPPQGGAGPHSVFAQTLSRSLSASDHSESSSSTLG